MKITCQRVIIAFGLILFSSLGYSECHPRLIIGSGADVTKFYPTSRSLHQCDITIDIRNKNQEKYLRPTHIIDIGHLSKLQKLSLQYDSHFKTIIFEHVGDGFFSFTKNERELNKLIKVLNSMLKENGILIYESFRGASSYSDGYKNQIDLGVIDLIEKHYDEIRSCLKSRKTKRTISDEFNFIKGFYEESLQKQGFQDITFKIKEDVKYRKYHPSQYPYYYLEIKAKKSVKKISGN